MKTNEILSNLDQQSSALELAIFNIRKARQPYLPDHIKAILDAELSRLRAIQSNLEKDIVALDEENRLIKNMLNNSKINEHHKSTITCVTKHAATTPMAKHESSTPCCENVDELIK